MKTTRNLTVLALLAAVWLAANAGRERLGAGTGSAFRVPGSERAQGPSGSDPFESFARWLVRFESSGGAVSLIQEGKALAAARAAALLDLIRTDPEQALNRAVSEETLARLPVEVAALCERRVRGVGNLYVICSADDAQEIRRVVEVDGESFEARVYGTALEAETEAGVDVDGVAIGGVLALREFNHHPGTEPDGGELTAGGGAAGPAGAARRPLDGRSRRIARESSLVAQSGGSGPSGFPSIFKTVRGSGRLTLLFARVDFTDAPGEPISADAAQRLVEETMNGFFGEVSGGRFSLSAAVTPLLRMPRTAAWYSANRADLPLLRDAREAALAAGFDAAAFDLDVVAFRRVIPAFAWSGQGLIGAKGVWLNGAFDLRVPCHEVGHNLGLFHANAWVVEGSDFFGPGRGEEYGDPFDVMGIGATKAAHFNGWSKSRLGWFAEGEALKVAASGTYRVRPLEATGGGLKALEIPETTSRSYWIEFRRSFPANPWLANGALLHWGYAAPRASYLLDAAPGTAKGRLDGAVPVGRTFSDPRAKVHVTPLSASAEGLEVAVNLGDFPGNRPPVVTLRADRDYAAPGERVALRAQASDPDADELSFFWEFGDGRFEGGLPEVSPSFPAAGDYVVRCTATDRKGGTASDLFLVQVGPTFTVSGRVTSAGAGVAGVVVTDGLRQSVTDKAGAYRLAGVPPRALSLEARAPGAAFAPSGFSNPLEVRGDVAGADFEARAPEDRAAFVERALPPFARPGKFFTVTVVFRNSGTTDWTPEGGLALVEAAGAAPPAPLASPVPPGGLAAFTFRVKAPLETGTAVYAWRMARSGRPFGEAMPAGTVTVRLPKAQKTAAAKGGAGVVLRAEAPFFLSGAAFAPIEGTASLPGGVAGVSWVNADTGGLGEAEGAETFRAEIPVAPGTNRITVTARDGAGARRSRRIVVEMAFD